VLVVVAGIFLLVVGLLTLGMGGLLLLGSALFAGAQGSAELESVVGGNLADAFAGVFAVIGGVALVNSRRGTRRLVGRAVPAPEPAPPEPEIIA